MNMCSYSWVEEFKERNFTHICLRPTSHERGTHEDAPVHRCACGVCLHPDGRNVWAPSSMMFVEAEEAVDALRAVRRRMGGKE